MKKIALSNFSTISKILSRGEESEMTFEESSLVSKIEDVTTQCDLKVSSRPAMIASLGDQSTETFWESGDEDRNKCKWIQCNLSEHLLFKSALVHIDNGRDLGNKVNQVVFKAGKTLESLRIIKQVQCVFLAYLLNWDHPVFVSF